MDGLASFIGWMEFFLILGLLGVFLHLGWRAALHAGRMSCVCYNCYHKKVWGDGKATFSAALLTLASYPFFRFAYSLIGDSLPDKTPKQEPPPPPPIPTFDIEGALNTLRVELRTKHQNVEGPLLDAFIVAGRQMLQKEFTTPDATSPDWEAKIEKTKKDPPWIDLRYFFEMIIAEIPLAPIEAHLPFDAPLKNVVSRKTLDKAFSNLNHQGNFPKNIERYGHWSQWARELTTPATTRMRKDFGLEQIGQPEGPEHISYILREYPGFADAPVPIGIPPVHRFSGMWVIAPQGTGKTTLLSSLLYGDLKEVMKGKGSAILFDSKGDLIEHARQLALFGKGGKLQGKLTLIEPSSMLAINFLDLGATRAHTIELLEYVLITLLDNDPTNNQLLLLRKLILACMAIPGATMMTMRDILFNGWRKYEEHIVKADKLTAEWFLANQFDEGDMRPTRQALRTKLEDLITKIPVLEGMFSAPKTKVHLGELMDAGNVIIVDNSVAALGEKGSELFGRFFVALILAAAQQRAGRKQEEKKPCFVYMDEAQTIIASDPTIAKIIQTCRSQNIALVLAHQELAQIKSDDVYYALGNCAIRMANPDKDAPALAQDFRTDADFLYSLPAHHFVVHIRKYIEWPLVVSVPNDPIWEWPKMPDEELAAIREKMSELYHFTPEEASKPPGPTSPTYDDSAGPRG